MGDVKLYSINKKYLWYLWYTKVVAFRPWLSKKVTWNNQFVLICDSQLVGMIWIKHEAHNKKYRNFMTYVYKSI